MGLWRHPLFFASKHRFGGDSDNYVWFGVGTFGTDEDPMRGLGNCYRYQ